MYIKIFCGKSQKYLLIESDHVTLNQSRFKIKFNAYPLVCAFMDERSLPIEEQREEMLQYISDTFKNVMLAGESGDVEKPNIECLICDMVPNTPYQLMVPVLSDKEEADKLEILSNGAHSENPAVTGYVDIAFAEVNGKTYFTTGSIYVMNESGQTIDKI